MTANLLVHLRAIEYIEFATSNFATDRLFPATQLHVRNPVMCISLGESQKGSHPLFGGRY